ncbi:MAG: hypothetical protein HUU21_19925 [Polyangiaceae bacterium]|nr:hypothetical protein [Polyangiaceae bacterium]
MSSVDDPNETAKKPAKLPSSPSSLSSATATAEERMIALLQEISSSLRHLDGRMGTLEERLVGTKHNALGAHETSVKADDEDAESLTDLGASHGTDRLDPADTDRPPPPVPGLALLSDGKVLLSVAYLKGAELDGRERWEGVILNVAEAWDAIEAVSDGCDDAASRVAGRILWRGKNKSEPEGSDGDGQE